MEYFTVKEQWKTILFLPLSTSCLFFTGCAVEPDSQPEVHSFLLTQLHQNFVEGGLSLGFDLDHRISDDQDAMGCHQMDFEDVEGNQGIDNGYGTLLPLLEASEVDVFGNLLEDGFSNEIPTPSAPEPPLNENDGALH